jgi:phosphatidylinositol-bisphosphatase
MLTYRKGQEALTAINYNDREINGKKISIKLKSPNWCDRVNNELKLVKCNTTALFNATSNSLLGEDFNIPSMSFDIEGGCNEIVYKV